MTPPELRLLGYPARLIIELPDGEHDISHLIETQEVDRPREVGAWIGMSRLVNEVAIERRARERAASRA